MERIKVQSCLIILEQGVLTSCLNVNPKKILHVEDTGKSPLLYPEPSDPGFRELPLCQHVQQAFPLLGPQGQK